MTLKWKILIPVILLTILFIVKFIMFNFPISEGKRVGNLSKISQQVRFGFLSSWEGTIDDGTGERLSTRFSVHDKKLAEELYQYEGKEVVVYYEEYFFGFPHETNVNVTSWKPKETEVVVTSETSSGSVSNTQNDKVLNLLNKTLFCALIGSLYSDQELYQKVKELVKKNNLYLYKQFDTCNN